MSRTVAIVGASADRRKFGNKSVRAHIAAGWVVFPVNPNESSIEGLQAYPSVSDIPDLEIDRISVYLPPHVTLKVLGSFVEKNPKEVWLNPGSDDVAVIDAANDLGLNIVSACSIVDLGFSPSHFPS